MSAAIVVTPKLVSASIRASRPPQLLEFFDDIVARATARLDYVGDQEFKCVEQRILAWARNRRRSRKRAAVGEHRIKASLGGPR